MGLLGASSPVPGDVLEEPAHGCCTTQTANSLSARLQLTNPKAPGKQDGGLPSLFMSRKPPSRLPTACTCRSRPQGLPQTPARPAPASTSPECCPGLRAGSAERAPGWCPLPASHWSRPRCRAQSLFPRQGKWSQQRERQETQGVSKCQGGHFPDSTERGAPCHRPLRAQLKAG